MKFIYLVFSFVLVGTNAWALNAPTSLKASAVSASQINLSFVDKATYEDGFIIERSLASSSGFSEIARTGQNIVSYSNIGLSANTTYYYRVKAFRNKSGRIIYSSYTAVASAKTNAATPPPSYTYSWLEGSFGSCSATACGTSGTQTRSVTCKRSDAVIVADSYCLATVVKPATSQSCSAPACSGPSITSGPTVSNITASSAKITWTVSEVATGQVEYGTVPSYGKFSTLEPSFTYSTHIQTLSGLTAGTLYYYRVHSKNANNVLVSSTAKTFTTTSTAPVYTYSYITGNFGSCSATLCGTSGTQTRSVVCTRNDGVAMADSFCSGQTKPATSQSCSAPACPPPPPAAACNLPWGGTIANGQSVTAFQASSVASGSTCVSQSRSCSNGVLSGSYQYQSCSVQSPPPPPPTGSFTHFVRPDGGTTAQCNGTANSAYLGSGTNQACAWKSITYALGMGGTGAKLVSGNKLYVESGTYRIGVGEPGAELNSGRCYSSYTPDCVMTKVPSGVTIEGNCSNRPKFVGTKGIWTVLDMSGSSNVTLKCLELTDGASCIERHNTANGIQKKPCATAPYEDYASTGIIASDSSNVLIDRVNIHGFAHDGMHSGRLKDWTFVDSNIDANGWAGIDGSIGGTSNNSYSGTIKFLRTSISYNGCIEKAGGGYEGCWGQVSGGYGDGIGTEATGGSWVFDTVTVVGNSSDGIDMLYVKLAGGNVTVKNSYVGHNAGNQVKANQDTLIENNVIVGNCSFHTQFGATMVAGENCRASGNSLSLGVSSGQTSTVRNNTITGEGDCLILNNSSSGGGGTMNITGNILDGRQKWGGGAGDKTCFHYYYGAGSLAAKNVSNNLIYNVKEGCQAGQICQSPQFVDPNFLTFDPHLKSTSPALGLGPNLNLVPLP